MGAVKLVEPVMPLCAVTSRYEDAFDWTAQSYASIGWQVALASEVFAFDMTNYYEAEMGENLKKQILVFQPLGDPAALTSWKHQSNTWEQDFKTATGFPEDRPLNLDPGYLTLAKFVLATTKDRDHRMYLRDGIFAEVTMSYSGRQWNSHRWTYPDYQTEPAVRFLVLAREKLKELYRE